MSGLRIYLVIVLYVYVLVCVYLSCFVFFFWAGMQASWDQDHFCIKHICIPFIHSAWHKDDQ